MNGSFITILLGGIIALDDSMPVRGIKVVMTLRSAGELLGVSPELGKPSIER